MSSARASPPWEASAEKSRKVYLYNSLTRKKELFTPKSHTVTWYSCGPTVYDQAHMGHARSYISFDILRRVLQDYFGYRILYVQNVTDIDDKIIKRARTNHLLEEYKNSIEKQTPDEIILDLKKASEIHAKKMEETRTVDPDKFKMYLGQLNKSLQANTEIKHLLSMDPSEDQKKALKERLISESEAIFGEWLDKEKGSTVTKNDIFMTLPRHYEDEYNKDMQNLDVLPPDIVTRVSEYVPEIVKFVEKIISNGYGYESNGSVYFDVAKFDSQPQHYYAKLVPEAYGNDTAALLEGEGALSGGATDKRSPNDFALWKKSKPGEPAWNSPWGLGRPGWHIECSAMAGEIFGPHMDIHSGGVDLKFPHHDNELAQSEAHYGCTQWVSYFLHTGHLHIDGCKMSKSLKNFVTIGDALSRHGKIQLRMAFLLHQWRDTLDYSANTLQGAAHLLRLLREFILTAQDAVRRGGSTTLPLSEAERGLLLEISKTEEGVEKALCDSVDTKSALEHLRRLVTETNKYINTSKQVNGQLVKRVSDFVIYLLGVFGVPLSSDQGGDQDILEPLCEKVFEFWKDLRLLSSEKTPLATKIIQITDSFRDEKLPKISLRIDEENSRILADSEKKSGASVLGTCESLAELREAVRAAAREAGKDGGKFASQLLKKCDCLRDEVLPPLGVRLEDKEGQSSSIKLVDPEALMAEIAAKKQAEEAKKEAEKKKKEEKMKKEKEEMEIDMQLPELLFRTDQYSAWTETGIPTHEKDGNEVTKSQVKKLTKGMELYKKKYEKWLQKKSQS